MLTQQEQEKLILSLMATAEVMGSEIKPNVALIMVDDLSGYPLHDVLQALTRVRRECTGKLTLKTILDMLAPSDGWLSANEAWAIALPALDEAVTVVWTPEIAKAFETARPLLEEGDKIGARMAFIPAYDRLVDQAKRENRKPVFEVNAGWDANMRDVAVNQAVTAGLLPPPVDDQSLLPPTYETPEQRKAREAEETENRERLSQMMRELSKSLREGNQRAINDLLNVSVSSSASMKHARKRSLSNCRGSAMSEIEMIEQVMQCPATGVGCE